MNRSQVNRIIHNLLRLPWYREQIVHRRWLPPRPGLPGRLAHTLHPELDQALHRKGINFLYSHQAQAINAVLEGKNVIVATPSASGKSLCHHIPVLNTLLKEKRGRALYLLPTKALTQDQLRGLKELAPPAMKQAIAIFDGDTPWEERTEIRQTVRILLTNPDMLHLGILPNHKRWSRLFRELYYVVIDEAHTYRGVFGSHMANVLRRLRRITELYGARPRFLLASATIGNPGELAQRLTGLPFHVVEEDGSPYGGKEFLFWNPPLVDGGGAGRRSANREAALLFKELVRQGVRTLTFVSSRQLAERLYTYGRQSLEEGYPELAERIAPYRGTYMPEDRRRIEQGLFLGHLLGVISTNALELGIDIGDLDATILLGYPGSVASTWQQAGRSGRRGQTSLTILIGRENPLDQYIMQHPEALFGKPFEKVLIAPENPYILKAHLLCAAYEMPLTPADGLLFGATFETQARELEAEGLLRFRHGRWFLDPRLAYPAEDVPLRATGNRYTLVEEDSGRVLETLEEGSAFSQLHPGAVYLHQGETYRVSRLEWKSGVAYARRVQAPYYTQAQEITDLEVLKVMRQKRAGRTQVYLGEVKVSTTVVSYKKKAHFSEEVLGYEPLDLPTQVFPTVALWFDFPEELLQEIRRGGEDLAGGLHAVEHAAIGILPLFALCDRNDIGGISTPLHRDTGRPQVFIYDGHPGGIGIAEKGYEEVEALWQATLSVVADCPCAQGCPSCIQSPKCGNNNHPLDKAVARKLLRGILDEEVTSQLYPLFQSGRIREGSTLS